MLKCYWLGCVPAPDPWQLSRSNNLLGVAPFYARPANMCNLVAVRAAWKGNTLASMHSGTILPIPDSPQESDKHVLVLQVRLHSALAN